MTASTSDLEPAGSEQAVLAQAEQAYQAGDVARMRELCARLASSENRELAARAAALSARVSVDPLAVFVLVAALVLFGVIVHAYMF